MANYNTRTYDPLDEMGLFDQWFDGADLGDWGSLFGGVGKLGTGIFEAFQGNKMMGLYEQNMKDQLAHQNRTFNANATQYNNNLLRSQNGAMEGRKTEDTRKMIPSVYG